MDARFITRRLCQELRAHGLKATERWIIVRNPALEVWAESAQGGLDRVILSDDETAILLAIEETWT